MIWTLLSGILCIFLIGCICLAVYNRIVGRRLENIRETEEIIKARFFPKILFIIFLISVPILIFSLVYSILYFFFGMTIALIESILPYSGPTNELLNAQSYFTSITFYVSAFSFLMRAAYINVYLFKWIKKTIGIPE